MHLKMPSGDIVCCKCLLTLLTNESTEAISVDPDQIASRREQSGLVLHFMSKRPLNHFSRR